MNSDDKSCFDLNKIDLILSFAVKEWEKDDNKTATNALIKALTGEENSGWKFDPELTREINAELAKHFNYRNKI